MWQRQRIGIDIDGVLGDHRARFASLLPTVAEGKTLDPESIVHIPLHECGALKDATGKAVAISEREEARRVQRHRILERHACRY